MTEEKKENDRPSRINLESRITRTLLVIVSAVLTFAGPTYVVYVLLNVLRMDYAISMASGLALFIVGFALILYLIRNKTISWE